MKISKTFEHVTQEQMDAVVAEVVPLLKEYKILLLQGDLGAGKTTFVGQLAQQLGANEQVTSPTFAYVNKYSLQSGGQLLHFDLYRLASVDAWYAAGFDDLMAMPNTISCIEWPDVIMPIIKSPALLMRIEHTAKESRTITLTSFE